MKYRPALSDYFFDDNAASKRRKRSGAEKAHDVNSDDLVGMTCLPPGIDQADVDSHIFIDDRVQSHRDDENGVVYKTKKT